VSHGRLRQFRNLQAARFAGVGAEDGRPAGVRDDSDAVALRQRLIREACRQCEHVFERLGAQDPGLLKQGFHPDIIGGQRSRVGSRGAFARRGTACLQDDDRFVATDPAGDLRKPPRIAERFHIQQDDARCGIVLPVLQEVVDRHIRLVADADEGGKTELQSFGCGEQGQPQSAAL